MQHELQPYKVFEVLTLPTGHLVFALNKDSLEHRMNWKEMDKPNLLQIFLGKVLEIKTADQVLHCKVEDVELFSSLAGFWNVFVKVEFDASLQAVAIGDEVNVLDEFPTKP